MIEPSEHADSSRPEPRTEPVRDGTDEPTGSAPVPGWTRADRPDLATAPSPLPTGGSHVSTGGSHESAQASAVAVVDEHEGAAYPQADGAVESDEFDEADADPDWAWVAEWRASDERTPWPQGIALGAFMLLLVASAIFVLTAGVADKPWLAIALNVLVAGGIGPQLWLARNLPVLRFIAWGAGLGVLVGWLACFVVPFPT